VRFHAGLARLDDVVGRAVAAARVRPKAAKISFKLVIEFSFQTGFSSKANYHRTKMTRTARKFASRLCDEEPGGAKSRAEASGRWHKSGWPAEIFWTPSF
jgi:hypothetical protein